MIKDENLVENAMKMGELTRANLTAMKSPLVSFWTQSPPSWTQTSFVDNLSTFMGTHFTFLETHSSFLDTLFIFLDIHPSFLGTL